MASNQKNGGYKMKKIILSLLFLYGTILQGMQPAPLSVQDLIDRLELPELNGNGELDLSHRGLTSLIGLENIPDPEQVSLLSLHDNFITIIPDRAFDRFPNLINLNLNNNRIVALPPEIFRPLINLQELYLQDLRLVFIEPHAFDGLENLILLSLEHNMLESLPKNLLDNLSNLETFNAQFNRINNLDMHLFANQNKLANIGLAGNNLERLPQITHLAQLKGLFISDNPALWLSDSEIEFIKNKKIFCNAPELLGGIPEYSLGDLIQELGENWQHELVHVDPHTQNQILILNNRRLTSLAGIQTKEMPEITHISAQNNYLSEIPRSFFWYDIDEDYESSRFPNLKTLELANNLFTTVPKLTHEDIGCELTHLNLQSNRITKIPQEISQLRNLVLLDLATNHITTIEGRALSLSQLENLYLEQNKLQTIARDIFTRANSLKELLLQHNFLGRKEDYQFPNQAHVKYYPQNPSSLKLLAARKIAEGFQDKNLVVITRYILELPNDTQDALLQVAPQTVAFKIVQAIRIKALLNQAKDISIKGLRKQLHHYGSDEQNAFFVFVPAEIRKELIKIPEQHKRPTRK